jgi:hypothetical protein
VFFPNSFTFSFGNVDGISGVHIGPGDRIYPNAPLDGHVRQRLREGYDSAFGCGVGEQIGTGLIRLYRCDVNDRASRLEMRNRRLAQVKHGVNVGLKSVFEFLAREMLYVVLCPLMRGIIDQDIQTAKFSDALVDQSNAMPLFANIAGNGDAATPLLLHHVRRFLSILMLAKIGNQEVRSFPRKGDSDCPADSAVASRNKRNPAFELVAALIGLLSVVGFRRHVPLASGRLLLRLRIRRIRVLCLWIFSRHGSSCCRESAASIVPDGPEASPKRRRLSRNSEELLNQHALKAVSPTSLEPRLEVSLKEHQYGGFLRA